MWSGPRNLSTALMRSFESRDDCTVWDEPFYAAYLKATELVHPLGEDVIAAGPVDPDDVAKALTARPKPPATLRFFKLMTHHMLESFPTDWFGAVRHAFLLRAPERVLASYAAKREAPTLLDIGFVQQQAIFDAVAERHGAVPPVIEAETIRRTPEPALRALCTALGIQFDPAMLKWRPGPRDSDGVWAPHWYASVFASTEFTPEMCDMPQLETTQRRIADEAKKPYEYMKKFALMPHT